MSKNITRWVLMLLVTVMLSGCVWYGGHAVPFQGHGYHHRQHLKHFDHHDHYGGDDYRYRR